MLDADQIALIHTVTIFQENGHDIYNKKTYDDGTVLSAVRVDLSTAYTGAGNDRTVTSNGIVYAYAKYTGNFSAIKRSLVGQRLTFNGENYQIVNVEILNDAEDNNPFSAEVTIL